jgi:hypothetical protein
MARVVEGADSLSHAGATRGGRQVAAPRSLLLIDCGSVFTKMALVGVVDHQYRLLARAQVATTVAPPQADLLIGVREGCQTLEGLTGRRLMGPETILTPEQDDGAGVDAIALTTSVGGPLRLLTTGPGREALAGLLYKSMGGLFAQPDALPAAPAEATQDDPTWRQLVEQLRALRPHAIVVVGVPSTGIRGSGTITEHAQSVAQWLDILRAGPREDDDARPSALPVVFAGTTEDGVTLASTLRSATTMVHTVEQLTPATIGPLSRALNALYDGVVLRETPGYTRLRSLSGPATATLTSLAGVARFLAHHYKMNVAAVDVGACSTSLVGATAGGEFLPAVFPQGGVGPGAGYVLRAVGAPSILRWLTLEADENTVREHALARMLRRRMLPSTPLELELEYALAREAIRLALHGPGSRLSGLQPIDVLLATGGTLTSVPHPAYAALIMLDAMQPRGITSLVLDAGRVATMLGSVAAFAPDVAAQMTENDAMPLLLGTAVSVTGTPTDGQPAVRAFLEYVDGKKDSIEVPAGALARLPLASGRRALLSLYPAPEIDAGLGPGQHARASEPIEGGALGLIVDARGRPLELPVAAGERVARLREWRAALGIGGET